MTIELKQRQDSRTTKRTLNRYAFIEMLEKGRFFIITWLIAMIACWTDTIYANNDCTALILDWL